MGSAVIVIQYSKPWGVTIIIVLVKKPDHHSQILNGIEESNDVSTMGFVEFI